MWKQFSVEDGGTLRLRWFRGASILYVVVAIAWLGFGSIALDPFEIVVAVALGFYAVRSVINTTTFAIHDRLLVVTHAPLPAWRNRQINVDAITHVWMRESSRRQWNTFEVVATLKDGRYLTLVRNTTRDSARDLTIELQTQLGLRHGSAPSASASSRST